MNKPKILVTRKWPVEVEQQLQRLYDVKLNEEDVPMSSYELKAAMQNNDALLSTVTDSISADVLNVKDRQVKFVGNFGVGYNNIDVEAAKNQDLIVTNTPGVLTECTADIAILLLLMSARRGSEGDRHIRNQEWTGWRPTHMLGHKVSGKTLGLIGFGRIAQAVAQRAHFGFGMNILFFNPNPVNKEVIAKYNAIQCDTVEDVLSEANFVSLHCPGGPTTRHLINEQSLKLMRPSAHLINTARGDVVDSQALVKALKQGWIAGAGLDVFEGEPNIDKEFLDMDSVSLLPHLGSATEETRIAMGYRVLDNLAAFLAGEEPKDRVV